MKKSNIQSAIIGITILAILLTTSIFKINAETPDAEGATKYAREFFKVNSNYFSDGSLKTSENQIKKCYQSAGKRNMPVFVFQNASKGFAILAQKDNNFAVVGYSQKGVFHKDSIPVQLKTLLRVYEDSLTVDFSQPLNLKAGSPVAVPLLDQKEISLNQYYHENVGSCPTGCVATAFAQIMAYYKYPQSGTGSNCYTHSKYGQLCADFANTVYNWDNTTDEDYKLLSFHVGVAMDMNYCGDQYGSIPSKSGYSNALVNYFKYHRTNGSTESYFIRNEIDKLRPVYVELPGDPGHAVVVDGYDSDGLFHINFGWGGHHNGYYMLNSNSTFVVDYKFGTNIGSAVFISPYTYKTNTQDSLNLVKINSAFNNSLGWDLNKPVNTWPGVLVYNERVIRLNISATGNANNKVSIPAEIGLLSELEVLNISAYIEGNLPESIFDLTKLKNLYIFDASNTLKANLNDKIGNLVNLESLALNLKSEGFISPQIGNLKKLKTLNIFPGNVSGSIPNEICTLTSLEYLDLSENKLSGNLPSDIGNLTKLTTLALNGNNLSGSIPESIGKCTKLYLLSLNNNSFTGQIPAGLGNMTLIENLDLSNNQFTSLPNEIGRLEKIRELNIGHNKLTALPDSIIRLQNIRSFYAGNNEISALPTDFGYFPLLQYFSMSFNKLTEIPDALCQIPMLESLTLRKNKIKKFPPSINLISPKLTYVHLDSNEISGPIPKELLENGKLEPMLISHNHFTFEDIPVSDKLRNRVGDQKPVKLSKNKFKVGMGDTLKLDIRNYTPFRLPDNEYTWMSVSKKKAVNSVPNPVLSLYIDEKTINDKYYCVVTNPKSPSYKYVIYESSFEFPCMNSVSTDTFTLELASEEELISEKYNGDFVISSKNLPEQKIEDRIVTLVPPLKLRGTIKWQASADGNQWFDLSESTTQNDLRQNYISLKQNELVLSPKTPAFYRCMVQDINCEPLYSDTIKVNPFGNVIYDQTVNVAVESTTIKSDSIEVRIPAGIYNSDFRMTIVKLDNPPAPPAGMKMSTAYDVTVSFGSTFEVPLEIKLKNIDKSMITEKGLPAVVPGYYDEIKREWVLYDNGGVSLKDSSVVFVTNHLTKLAWFELAHGFYTHIHTTDKVNVIYVSGKGTGEDNNYLGYQYTNMKKPKEPWYNSNMDPDKGGTPMLIQDIGGYMDLIIKKFKEKGLETPDLRFNIYVSNMGASAFGSINVFGYIAGRGYFKINSQLAVDRDDLKKTLAHEYMHYTQDYYTVVLTDNYFFTEAHAPTASRIVWPLDTDFPTAEPEDNLKMALLEKEESGTRYRSIFHLLSEPWDYAGTVPVIEKFSASTIEANISSTFLHYMQCLRSGTKLDMATLLKNYSWYSSATNWTWRNYINTQTTNLLGTSIGDEYDDYVRYLLSGENENFTVINKGEGNPYSNIIKHLTPENNAPFARRLVYNFAPDDNNPQEDEVEMTVPYLSSKVLMLYNQTSDRAVVVHYKRLHKKDSEHKIYFCKYDKDKKITTYHDISDSTEYNMFIEARTEKSIKESQNICFLLMVNKKCPSMVGVFSDFDAEFELKAFPVYDIEYLTSAWIAGDNGNSLMIHNYSNGGKDGFVIPGVYLTFSNPNVAYHTVNHYSSNKSSVTDSSYVINISFGSETRMEYSDPFSLPGIQIIDKQIKIFYNFKHSKMSINLKAHYINKFETTYEEKPRIVLSSTWDDEASLSVKDLHNMKVSTYGKDVRFSTNNSTETQAVIESLSRRHSSTYYDDKGEVKDETVQTYISTDYSGGDVILIIALKCR